MTETVNGRGRSHGDRKNRIAVVARILFGCDPDYASQPEKGWQARLARAMGVGKSTITSTLDLDRSDIFDRKLAAFIAERLPVLHRDLQTLEILQSEILQSTFEPIHRHGPDQETSS